MIYLDNNATTRMAPAVREAMTPFLDEYFANPSSPYTFARRSALALGQAREHVATTLGCEPNQVVFTSGGSEAIHLALHSACAARTDTRHLITSTVEHAATLAAVERYEAAGYRVTRLQVDAQGHLDWDEYIDALCPETTCVSLMAANNETGVLFPIERYAAAAGELGVPFHCDATQAIGKIPFSAALPGLTYTAISAHKFHGPKGVGALITDPKASVTALITGGDQEFGRRAGTENVAGIVGMGVAARLVPAGLEAMANAIRPLRDQVEAALDRCVEDVRIIGRNSDRLPNTILFTVAGQPSEVLIARFDMDEICVSAGSACASGATEASHVLRAMQVPQEHAFGAVRISLSRYTTRDEISTFMECLGAQIGINPA